MAPAVKLFWWRWKHPHRLNFGDEFSAPLIEKLSGRRVRWASPASCDLVAAGSIIGLMMRKQRSNSPTFWGSGFLHAPGASSKMVEIDARAVRGAHSRERVLPSTGDVPAVGDPGLLASHLLEQPIKKRYALGVIPHYSDATDPRIDQLATLGNDVRIIDVAWTPQEVAQEIAACDTIISSSLHGLIFADSLGVPNLRIRVRDKLGGGDYKFGDYYSVFDAPDRHRVHTLAKNGPMDLGHIVRDVEERYIVPHDLGGLQEGLLRALPV